MTERQNKRIMRRICEICMQLETEGCAPDEVADAVRAIYTLAAKCID